MFNGNLRHVPISRIPERCKRPVLRGLELGTKSVRALVGVSMLCSLSRNFTPTVPLTTLECKWVPELLEQRDRMLRGRGRETCDGLPSHPGGVAKLLATPCRRIRR